MRYLLDANVLSELVKPSPDAGVANWFVQNESGSAISEVTIGELTKGAYFLPSGKKRTRILLWIDELQVAFEGRLLPATLDIFRQWGELCGTYEAQGRRWPLVDSLLSATALVHDLTVVTRNTADFPPEVRTLNPWKK